MYIRSGLTDRAVWSFLWLTLVAGNFRANRKQSRCGERGELWQVSDSQSLCGEGGQSSWKTWFSQILSPNTRQGVLFTFQRSIGGCMTVWNKGRLWAALLAVFCVVLMSGEVQARSQVAAKEGFLLAAFGTSVPEAKSSFQAVEKAFRGSFAKAPVAWTYTSQIIRKKLDKQGEHIPGIAEALRHLKKQGVRVVRVQPLHVMAGEEYTELERALLLEVKKHPGRFDAVYIGRPLLESREDAEIVAKAVLASCKEKRGEACALVLMGHGQEHGRAGLTFEGVRQVFTALDPLVFMATVEGQRGFEELLAELKARQVKKVLLRPLMVVAGDHARNDLGGSEDDSWASRLKAEGFEVDVNLEGLGLLPEVAKLYIEHASQSRDDLTREPKKK